MRVEHGEWSRLFCVEANEIADSDKAVRYENYSLSKNLTLSFVNRI